MIKKTPEQGERKSERLRSTRLPILMPTRSIGLLPCFIIDHWIFTFKISPKDDFSNGDKKQKYRKVKSYCSFQ